MSNLFGVGLSGLSAAQAGLATTSNNISNVNTPGYSRQTVSLSTQDAGAGVKATGVERQYQQFLNTQLNDAKSGLASQQSQLGQIQQINNLLGDSEAGLAPLMQEFFGGLQTLSENPDDAAARESLLGNARNMSAQFRAFSEYFSDMHESVDSQLDSAVSQINNYADQISQLNDRITLTEGKTGATANNLRDQRDQLVTELSELADVKMSVQDGRSYNISLAGQSLVDSAGAHELTLTQAETDPTQRVVAYKTAAGDERELNSDTLKGGRLGGLLAFRGESLEPAEARLGQLAHSLSAQINAVHSTGENLAGETGQDFFTTSAPNTYSSRSNLGSAGLEVNFANGGEADLRGSNYRVDYNGEADQFQITRMSDGQRSFADAADTPISVDGLEIGVGEGELRNGDSFVIKPFERSAADMDLAINTTSQIAASQGGGSGDNRNALAMAELQDQKTVNGDASFNSAYAQLVSDIGNQTRSLQVNSAAQERLTGEIENAQQSVSGVNLEEESVNLQYFQQMYQANAKVIQTASTLFDTLLGIRA